MRQLFLEKSQSWSNRLRFQIIPQLYKPVDYGKVVDDTDKLVMLPFFKNSNMNCTVKNFELMFSQKRNSHVRSTYFPAAE